MKIHWLNKNNSDKIIVFFSGWGQSPQYFEEQFSSKSNVVMLYNYSHLNFSELENVTSSYNRKEVIGWSFGVLVAALFMEKYNNIDFSTSINGSLNPIDDDEGIPTKIFQGTLKLLSNASWEKFIFRMIGDRQEYAKFIEQNDRDIDSLKEELTFLGTLPPLKQHVLFHQVFISTKDRIFPSENLIKYWETNQNTFHLIDTQHFPFHHYSKWEEIAQLNQTIDV